jgi:hypothetical protein
VPSRGKAGQGRWLIFAHALAAGSAGCGEALPAGDGGAGDAAPADAAAPDADASGPAAAPPSSLSACGRGESCGAGEGCDFSQICHPDSPCNHEEGDQLCHARYDDRPCAAGEQCRLLPSGIGDEGSGPYVSLCIDPLGCDLATLLERHSGPDALDCGTVPLGADPTNAVDCARAADEAGEAFRVRFAERGVDSAVDLGYARSPTGERVSFSIDDFAATGPGCTPRVSRTPCEAFGVIFTEPPGAPIGVDDQAQLTCEQTGPPYTLLEICRSYCPPP